jgi:phenylpyruvate tautomerase
MPTAIVLTNVPGDKVKDTDFALELSKIVAQGIGKPEQYVMTNVQTDQVMTYSGKQDPCAFVRIVSIGGLNPETNVKLSEDICGLLEDRYGVDPSRSYIEFVDSERHMFGWNSRTF